MTTIEVEMQTDDQGRGEAALSKKLEVTGLTNLVTSDGFVSVEANPDDGPKLVVNGAKPGTTVTVHYDKP